MELPAQPETLLSSLAEKEPLPPPPSCSSNSVSNDALSTISTASETTVDRPLESLSAPASPTTGQARQPFGAINAQLSALEIKHIYAPFLQRLLERTSHLSPKERDATLNKCLAGLQLPRSPPSPPPPSTVSNPAPSSDHSDNKEQPTTMTMTAEPVSSSAGASVSCTDNAQLNSILAEFEGLFHKKGILPVARIRVTHTINTAKQAPISLPMHHATLMKRQEIDASMKELLRNDIIEPSKSPWAFPLTGLYKGKWLYVDYRRLNSITKHEPYPTIRIDEIMDVLTGACWFSTIDLTNIYWQIPIAPEDRAKTAFIVPGGLYQWKRVPTGLSGVNVTFQRAMDEILAGLRWTTCIVYLNGIVVFGRSFEEHNQRLREVLTRLREAGLHVKREKCQFAKREIQYLDHIIGDGGIRIDPKKVNAILQLPVPTSINEVKRFLALATYYQRFIKHYSDRTQALRRLEKSAKAFAWTAVHAAEFDDIKTALTKDVVLPYPDFTRPFRIETDASAYGLGAVIAQQMDDNDWRPLAYASRLLTDSEKSYTVTERECLAVVWAIEKFKHYIDGRDFTVMTDHYSLCWLISKHDVQGRLGHWMLLLQSYRPSIMFRKGSLNANADALSRGPLPWNDLVRSCATSAAPSEIGQASDIEEEEEEQEEHEQVEHADVLTMALDVEAPASPAMPMPGINEWKHAQQEDVLCRPLLAYLEDDDEFLVQLSSPAYKKLRKRARHCRLVDGHLERKIIIDNDHDHVRWCRVVPARFISVLLRDYHDAPAEGHPGVHKTFDALRTTYWWPSMQRDIYDYIATCSVCQQAGACAPRTCLPTSIPATQRILGNIAVDLLGPFPRTADGNKYIVVCTDHITHWIEAAAVHEVTVASMTDFLMRHVIAPYGAPRFLITHRATNVPSSLMAAIAKHTGIKQRVTIVRQSPMDAPSMLEQFSHVLGRTMARFTRDHADCWDIYLSLFLFAYRTTRHPAAHQAPFRHPMQDNEANYEEDLRLRLLGVLDTTGTTIKAIHRRLAGVGRGRTKQDVAYEEGDIVWIERCVPGMCRSGKMPRQKMRGPFKVTTRHGSNAYRLIDLATRKLCHEPADQLVRILRQEECAHIQPVVDGTGNNSSAKKAAKDGAAWRYLVNRWLVQ